MRCLHHVPHPYVTLACTATAKTKRGGRRISKKRKGKAWDKQKSRKKQKVRYQTSQAVAKADRETDLSGSVLAAGDTPPLIGCAYYFISFVFLLWSVWYCRSLHISSHTFTLDMPCICFVCCLKHHRLQNLRPVHQGPFRSNHHSLVPG